MKLLVTGGAGFIGSNYIRWVMAAHPEDHVVNFDKLTYAGNLENLSDLEHNPRYSFVKGDIASVRDVARLFQVHTFDAVVNFAAETHVDRSLHMGVRRFIQTNVLGVQNLLDAVRRHRVPRFLQVSTDEVYGSLGPEGLFTEATPLHPNNPYAATKASADLLVAAAGHSHGLEVVITRCSNNFGPYQFPEKLIPLMITNALEDQPLPVYGDGLHVRDWIYVLDHCAAVDLALRQAPPGALYNIGGGYQVPNLEIVRSILKLLNKPESLIRFVKDRPGHDRRYAMDSRLIRETLGWQPAHPFDAALKATVEWYLANRVWWQRVRSGEYRAYYAKMYGWRG